MLARDLEHQIRTYMAIVWRRSRADSRHCERQSLRAERLSSRCGCRPRPGGCLRIWRHRDRHSGGGSSTAAAEQRWILAESWARLADSVNGHYWTPREPGRPERIARAYVGRDAFVQVVLHQDSEDRDIIACGGPVYIWAPTSMTHEARGGLGSLARGCCTRVVFGIVSTKIAAAAAPPKRRGWIFW